ncbi:polymer-forming cytoskeletal protein [Candidatus Gracilibacteria bacterium]|nr:polymer-forming cytoskeletal protein [Candidatus Gracilibacteria bacterium]
MKHLTKQLMVVSALAVLFLLPASASANIIRNEENVLVNVAETLESTGFFAGQNVRVDGVINGDVFCAGSSVTITGTVNGDVICGGQSLTIDGHINGNVRSAGQFLTINGSVERNVMMFGQKFILGQKAVVRGEVHFAGQWLEVLGNIKKDLSVAGQSVIIQGVVERDVRAEVQDFTATKPALIKGKLVYASKRDAKIDDGVVKGGIEKRASLQGRDEPEGKRLRNMFIAMWAGWKLYSIFALIVLGLAMIWARPKKVAEVLEMIQKHAGSSILWGAASMIIAPIVFVVLMMTVVGIPLALVGAVLYGITVAVSRIYIAMLVGQKILLKLRHGKTTHLAWGLVLGMPIVVIICAIPLLGWALSAVAVWAGTGAALQIVMQRK